MIIVIKWSIIFCRFASAMFLVSHLVAGDRIVSVQ